jgi:flavin-dependent dehydrogenase
MSRIHDVIVVGARCAGSPTAMLLARQGHRVLLVDRASFPSDTLSTHVVQPLAVASLARWGLLERLVASGCPPIHTYAFDFGPLTLSGSPGTPEAPVAYCPRRIVLDALLLSAAAEAGAEVREEFTVDALLVEDGRVVGVRGHGQDGQTEELRARVVVGADGRGSKVAAGVRPPTYHEKPPLMASYYAYWSGLPMDGRFEIYIRPARGFAAVATHDGLTCVMAGWPHAEFENNKKDHPGHYRQTLSLCPAFDRRLQAARLETRLFGAAVPGFFRQPFGPGWALVGDAGYNKDPITAQGIRDAFRDAELCASALDQSLRGLRSFDEAMAGYQRDRDQQSLPMYEMTCQLATLEPPPLEMQRLLGALHGNQPAMDGFVQANAGTISPATFFSPANLGALLGQSAPAPAS